MDLIIRQKLLQSAEVQIIGSTVRLETEEILAAHHAVRIIRVRRIALPPRDRTIGDLIAGLVLLLRTDIDSNNQLWHYAAHGLFGFLYVERRIEPFSEVLSEIESLQKIATLI